MTTVLDTEPWIAPFRGACLRMFGEAIHGGRSDVRSVLGVAFLEPDADPAASAVKVTTASARAYRMLALTAGHASISSPWEVTTTGEHALTLTTTHALAGTPVAGWVDPMQAARAVERAISGRGGVVAIQWTVHIDRRALTAGLS